MKRIITAIYLMALMILILSSCEKVCTCTNVRTGSSAVQSGVYGKSDCDDQEDYYNQLNYGNETYDCTYKTKK